MALDHINNKRIFSHLNLDGRKVKFLLDCGATLINNVDGTDDGFTSATVNFTNVRWKGTAHNWDYHRKTTKSAYEAYSGEVDFYVTDREVPILGIEACHRLDLIRIVEDNISEVKETASSLSSVEAEQMAELQMIASAETIARIMATAKDIEYVKLIRQITTGWPESPREVETELRPYFTFSDELSVSCGLVFKGDRLVVPRPVRADILDLLNSARTGVIMVVYDARARPFSGPV